MNILKPEFFQRDTLQVAKDLIGKKLVRKFKDSSGDYQIIAGTISETECYTHDDPASHCFIGKTQRNSSMFGPVGHAYVYISYGIHFGFNIVARDLNSPAGGVLIRAAILDNNTKINGPGNLTKFFKINKSHDSLNLLSENSEIFVLDAPKIYDHLITITPRIGISKAKEYPWRFVLK